MNFTIEDLLTRIEKLEDFMSRILEEEADKKLWSECICTTTTNHIDNCGIKLIHVKTGISITKQGWPKSKIRREVLRELKTRLKYYE